MATQLTRLNQCVSEKLHPFRPIKIFSRQKCRIHLLRANCQAINYDSNDHDENTNEILLHITTINAVYLDYQQRPYFMCLVDERDDSERGYYTNALTILCHVSVRRLHDDEIFYGIDEMGERNMATLQMIIKSLMDILNNVKDMFILMVDELQIDILYSSLRTVVLPQRMVCIYSTDHVPLFEHIKLFNVPLTEEAAESQTIYKTFLMYNTMLTLMLKQNNPFNLSKNISLIFRQLGRCPNNKDRLKCCDLIYGANAPGHVMCPPREMVKRIYHYSKWARSPNKYLRYYELIVKKKSVKKFFADETTELNARRAAELIILDWFNFIDDLRRYFGIRM